MQAMRREFETALSAFHCNDANPMRLYLGLPLKGDCEDCGQEKELTPFDKNLVCMECGQGRHEELMERYSEAWRMA